MNVLSRLMNVICFLFQLCHLCTAVSLCRAPGHAFAFCFLALPQALDDVEAKFQLITAAGSSAEEALASLTVADEEGGEGAGTGAAAGSRRRRPQKASAYAACRRAGLGAAVRGLGLTLEQFSENVEATYKRHETRDPAVSMLSTLRGRERKGVGCRWQSACAMV